MSNHFVLHRARGLKLRIRYPMNPDQLHHKDTPFIKDLKQLGAQGGHGQCLKTIRKMVKDLKNQGHESQFIKNLTGVPNIMELKANAKGAGAGGARVYFFLTESEEAFLGAAECKKDDAANEALIDRLAVMAYAYHHGIPLFVPKE
jgi:hypothetical protein